jgi:hypothetical protein
MQGPEAEGAVHYLDCRTAGAGAHGRTAIRRGMMFAGRGVLTGRLLVVLVPFHRLRHDSSSAVILTVPWTGGLTAPQYLRDQDQCGKDACGATIEHD